MPRVINKARLCTTAPMSVFTVESVGGTPFYNRRSDFERLIAKHVTNPKFKNFFAMPYFESTIHGLEWHVDTDLAQAVRLSSVRGTSQYNDAKRQISEAKAYFNNLKRQASEQEARYFNCMLKYIDSEDIDDMVFVTPSQVILGVWGMKALPGGDMVSAIVTDVDDTRLHRITFKSDNARLKGTASFMRRHGYRLHPGIDVPSVTPAEGFKFVGWSPNDPSNALVDRDLEFTAMCEAIVLPPEMPTTPEPPILPIMPEPEPIPEPEPEPEPLPPVMHNVHFEHGGFGTFSGAPADTQVADGMVIAPTQVPMVTPIEGYRFTGWNTPLGNPIHSDTTFYATYEKIALPWWKTLFTEGCLRTLLWFLLALLLLLLIALVLTHCSSCTHYVGGCNRWGGGNGHAIEHITTPDGRHIDDNGNRRGIRDITVDEDGNPIDDWDEGNEVAPPLVDDNGNPISPVAPQDPNDPSSPQVMGDRLNIFFEDDNADFDKWAQDFHRAYPGNNYQIIGKDKNSNWIQIKVPVQERNRIREELPTKITSPRFRVVDETVMQGGPTTSSRQSFSTMSLPAGWHIDAAGIRQAWNVTKGNPDVTIAVVDDGIALDHDLFKDRITKSYNIFRCDDHLSAGQGHGTHVAGIAAGNTSHLNQEGVAGVAPECKIMPVQVFDNGQCTASSLIRGIMYAIRNDADVVNISIGTAYPVELGYIVPVEIQQQVAQTQFKGAEDVWNWVFSQAAAKNTILVFAAGNSHLLAAIEPQLRSSNTINVGAVGQNFSMTPWSNFGPTVSVTAPGVDIKSSMPGNRYQEHDGTSMAAPIVTGTVALMKSLNKNVTVTQALQALTSTGHVTAGGTRSGPSIQADRAVMKIKQQS